MPCAVGARSSRQNLEEAKIEAIRELASPTIRYRDPMREVVGIDAYIAMLHQLCRNLDEIRVKTLERSETATRSTFSGS